MSVHIIYYKDGAKIMRPVKDETEYRLLRDSQHNRTADKHHMVQMNYSCLPNENGALKGATRLSRSVGMDIDFDPKAPDYEQKMASVPDLVLGKKDELGLLMLEHSANKGYHVAFRRKPELSQEENLRWASQLLGVQYDKGAKDITRVFFTPPCEKLLFVDKELFDNSEMVNTEVVPVKEKNTETEKAKNTDFAEQSDSSLFVLPFLILAFPTPTSSASGGQCTTTRRSLCAATSPLSLPSTSATSAVSTASCWTASFRVTTDFPRRRSLPVSTRL